ncbi:hypothetical protein PYW07_002750 [Mythimna separata]|uniref:CCHC-type domain-containing protein n=1 Tax=Mythimna separata TaxID=271217 RepID=A0AAD7YFW8_MYTSE|nr:hypothetical protein PYW07_002750 [Mythimna separata]
MPPITRRAHADDKENEGSSSDEETHAAANPACLNITATATQSPATISNMISMSEEQLTRLLTSVMRSVATPTPFCGDATGPTQPTATQAGSTVYEMHGIHSNFTRCTARFDGAARSTEALEAFVESVLVFKECASVSDEHALRGLPMLLTGDAAVWWQGVKPTVKTWDDAIRRLRFMYGAPRPAHRIFREIFAREQSDGDSVDSFISRVRSEMSRIPYNIPDVMQVDIVYGLLHRKIRKRVSRDSVSSVDCLLERARYVEETLSEVRHSKSPSPSTSISNDTANTAKSRNVEVNDPSASTDSRRNLSRASDSSSNIRNDTNSNTKRIRPRCIFCKRFGHSIDECRNKTKPGDQGSNAPPSCYGCGREGVIRSKCPTCTGTPSADKVSFQSAITHVSELSQPTVKIGVEGLVGVAVLDTGATESLASPGLYKILLDSGTTFTKTRRNLGLADETQQVRDLLSCDTNVTIQGRVFPITFLVIPEADNRTLLGQDFIARAGIIVDLQHKCWHFSSSPEQKFLFVQSFSLTSTSDAELKQVNTTGLALREDGGTKLSPARRTQVSQLRTKRVERFATKGPPTTHAADIRVDAKQELTASPPRMSQGKRELLDGELESTDDPFRGRGWSKRGYLMCDGTLHRIRARYFRPGMKPFVSDRNFKRCAAYQRYQIDNRKPAGLLQAPTHEGKRAPIEYKVGDLVLLKTQGMNNVSPRQSAECIPRRDGPYRIREVVSPTTYLVEGVTTGEHVGRYHVSDMTPFIGDVGAPVRRKRRRGRPRRVCC